jgi:hypothetical protein
MTDERMKLVEPILNTIENKDIKEFAIVLLDNLPEYVWTVPASSTGKYHPAYSLGEGGLMRHQMAVVKFLNFFFELEQYSSKLTSREMDLMRVAGLVHDGMKSGSQEQFSSSKYTKFEHPVMMATMIRSYDGKYLNHDEIELIADAISKHMGQWNTDKKSSTVLPKPNDKFSRMLHVADYLSSRKCLTMDFESSVTANTKVEWDENYTLSFGKHSGKRLIDVYQKHPDYIAWCEENIKRQDFLNMIKAMKESFNKDSKN